MASISTATALQPIYSLFTDGTTASLSDEQLLERFASGDGDAAERAFAGLVERHGAMVFHACRSVLRDSHDAEDAFQATFIILALKAATIRGRQSLASWLYSVAYNTAATARAAAERRRIHEARASGNRSPLFFNKPSDDLDAAIHEELERIPERYRSVLVLCYLEGLTQHQAAERLGCPVGTVQSRLCGDASACVIAFRGGA